MRDFWRDLQYAARQMGRSPGFAAISVLSLALGIGATAAMFSIIWAALLDPFPYPTANRIVRLRVKPASGQERLAELNGPHLDPLAFIGTQRKALPHSACNRLPPPQPRLTMP